VARVERLLRGLVIAAVAASVLLTLAFSLGLIAERPILSGEAEPLHEATRIHDGLALYTDPIAGAFDYGPVPTRCYVAYTPLWSWVLSHVPTSSSETVGRLLDTLLWFGVLAWLATRARPAHRHAAWLAAGAVAGVYVLAIFATSARPDAAAVALAGVALARGVRRAELDAACGALLALAAWVKPNVLGVALGLFLLERVVRPRSWRALAGALAVSVPLAVTLHVVSHGLWLHHMMRTLGQPLEARVWWLNLSSRGMFLLPAVWITWAALRSRADPAVRMALWAWVASLGWAIFSLSKTGAASNYWMEPAIAAVVVASIAPAPPLVGTRRTAFWMAAAAAAVWLAVATAGGVIEAFVREPRRVALLARARTACQARADEVVFTDAAGTQMALDGRIVDPGIQTIFLVLQGHMPVATWIADVQRPGVACVVEEGRLFDVIPEMGAAVDARFVRVDSAEDWTVLALRDRVGR
jgi:hypothetical protein